MLSVRVALAAAASSVLGAQLAAPELKGFYEKNRIPLYTGQARFVDPHTVEVGEAKVVSLKREKDDAKSVKAGFECGIGLEGVKDIQEGDVLAFFRKVEVARKLTAALA